MNNAGLESWMSGFKLWGRKLEASKVFWYAKKKKKPVFRNSVWQDGLENWRTGRSAKQL